MNTIQKFQNGDLVAWGNRKVAYMGTVISSNERVTLVKCTSSSSGKGVNLEYAVATDCVGKLNNGRAVVQAVK